MNDGIKAEPPYRYCALCGDELNGTLDRDTGVCEACSTDNIETAGLEANTGEWLGSLNGLTVRAASKDLDGPVLQLDGTDGMAAVELDSPLSIKGLEIAVSKLRSVYLSEVEHDE